MICAIHQPQFVPWLGHFQKINRADTFVLLDNVQFRKNEFQNRNRICTFNGVNWLTVPVSHSFGDTLQEVRIAEDRRWIKRMWNTLEHTYKKTPYFATYGPQLREIIEHPYPNLAGLNAATVLWLMNCFGITTAVVTASDLDGLGDDRTGRLVDICKSIDASHYLSGAQAQCYLDLPQFEQAGIIVQFQNYEHPQYTQVNSRNGFVSHMSAIDGLFNCGGGEEGRLLLNL